MLAPRALDLEDFVPQHTLSALHTDTTANTSQHHVLLYQQLVSPRQPSTWLLPGGLLRLKAPPRDGVYGSSQFHRHSWTFLTQFLRRGAGRGQLDWTTAKVVLSGRSRGKQQSTNSLNKATRFPSPCSQGNPALEPTAATHCRLDNFKGGNFKGVKLRAFQIGKYLNNWKALANP